MCQKTPSVSYYKSNETSHPDFVMLCKMTESELKEFLTEELKQFYPEVISDNGFLYAKGTDPVLLTAHMDTVHAVPVKDFFEGKTINGETVITSTEGIGGDDRCGVYMTLRILTDTDYRPSILFCEGEENGGVGSNLFIVTDYLKELEELKFLIELDRANARDAVFYQDDNTEFHNWIEDTIGYKEAYGSFTDISHLCPACEVAGVNLSCGYYNAHTTMEYVVIEEMMATIEAVKVLLEKANEVKQFKYKPTGYSFSNYSNFCRYYGYCGWGGDYEDTYVNTHTKKSYVLWVSYYDPETEKEDEDTVIINKNDENHAWGRFFISHPRVCYVNIMDSDFYGM